MITIRRDGRVLATVADAGAAYRWLTDNDAYGVRRALANGYTVRDEAGRDVFEYDVATDSYRTIEGEIPPRP